MFSCSVSRRMRSRSSARRRFSCSYSCPIDCARRRSASKAEDPRSTAKSIRPETERRQCSKQHGQSKTYRNCRSERALYPDVHHHRRRRRGRRCCCSGLRAGYHRRVVHPWLRYRDCCSEGYQSRNTTSSCHHTGRTSDCTSWLPVPPKPLPSR